MRHGRAILGVAAAALLLTWFVGWNRSPPAADPTEARGVDSPVPPRLGTVAQTPTSPGPRDAPETPSTAPGLEPPAPADDGFPGVRVEVRAQDGTPVEDGTVYALPAGSRGTDDAFDVAQAEVAGGSAWLRVPAAGRYDVGALAGSFLHALAEDVDVPREPPVVLSLPPTAEVRFEVAPEVASAARGNDHVVVRPAGEGAVVFPGRGQRRSGDLHLYPLRSPSVALPAGQPFVTERTGSQGIGATESVPSPFEAPSVVRLVPSLQCEHRVVFEPESRTFPYDVDVPVDFDWDGVVTHVTFRCRRGRELRGLGGQWTHRPARPEGTVSWSGPSVAPGRTSYRGTRTPSEIVEVRIRVLEPSASPRQDEHAPAIRLRHVGAAADDLQVSVGWDGRDWAAPSLHELRSHGLRAGNDEGTFAWAHAYALPWWVAGPVRVDGRDAELDLVEGGFLVAVPERMPPEGLVPRLRRADGAPLVVGEESKEGPVELRPGLVLGPFVPGEVELEVVVGNVVVARATATVVARSYVPLPIRALAPPR